jgi:hypothetical protein
MGCRFDTGKKMAIVGLEKQIKTNGITDCGCLATKKQEKGHLLPIWDGLE